MNRSALLLPGQLEVTLTFSAASLAVTGKARHAAAGPPARPKGTIMARRRTSGLGWIQDLPDHRDLAYAAPSAALETLPREVDLRPECPPVYNQGRIGSCTA